MGTLFIALFSYPKTTVALAAALFRKVNAVAGQRAATWKLTEGVRLIVFFIAGCWNSLQCSNWHFRAPGTWHQREKAMQESLVRVPQFQAAENRYRKHKGRGGLILTGRPRLFLW